VNESHVEIRPLEGVKIIDFTRQMAGPYATMALADYGADVIKVESKPDGDPSRQVGLRSWERSAPFSSRGIGKAKHLC